MRAPTLLLSLALPGILVPGIEWGGRLDPDRKVRIAYLRARRMLLYRIAEYLDPS